MNILSPRPHVLIAGLFLLSAGATLFAAPPSNQLPQVRGTIASVAGNHTCFDLTDRNGNRMTVQLSKETHFYMNQTDYPLQDVLFVGDQVQVSLNAENVAVDVTNRNRARAAAADIRPLLACTDDEWQVFGPLITTILTDQRLVYGQGRSDLRNAINDLRTTLQDPHAMNSDIRFKLRTLRTLREKAQADLATVRQNLTALLTPRQEAILVEQSILE